jgi:hypothetical protein
LGYVTVKREMKMERAWGKQRLLLSGRFPPLPYLIWLARNVFVVVNEAGRCLAKTVLY